MALAAAAVLLLLIPGLLLTAMAATPYPHGARGDPLLGASKRYEGSSDLVDLRYHMGPVLSAAPLRLYVLWYGRWDPAHQAPVRDFLLSLSDPSPPPPSVAAWWATAALYADQTLANVTRRVALAGEAADASASLGRALSRLDIQRVLAAAVAAGRLPADARGGAYLVLTAPGVGVQDFCRAVCGFHYFTFPSLVGHTLPYAWVGHSGGRCADVCAYPFALPSYMSRSGVAALRPPNGDAGVDGMVSVIAHELAELATNPLINAWYAGEDPTAPTEIADLCEGVYGTGGGGGYAGKVAVDAQGRSWNVNGRNGRKFLVQWLWSPEAKACVGPNASD
ncbi:protein EXORDIUM-like 5 [Panicum hallii]|nr:protein EXORDIUM-like 5 [Panicum hallii]